MGLCLRRRFVLTLCRRGTFHDDGSPILSPFRQFYFPCLSALLKPIPCAISVSRGNGLVQCFTLHFKSNQNYGPEAGVNYTLTLHNVDLKAGAFGMTSTFSDFEVSGNSGRYGNRV